jgi:hypothetical protein
MVRPSDWMFTNAQYEKWREEYIMSRRAYLRPGIEEDATIVVSDLEAHGHHDQMYQQRVHVGRMPLGHVATLRLALHEQ